MHLAFLLTCLLLVTGTTRGNPVNETNTESGDGGDEGGSGQVTRGMKEEEGSVVVVVENGTEEAVVLDCPYHLEEKDLDGIHIRWYHPKHTRPFYQWIPDNMPQTMGKYRDRVDLTYEVSTDALQRYRALRILNPTTDFAGRYRCLVSTYTTDITRIRDLIVYSEPTGLDVRVEEKEEGQVEVICNVEEMYPQPVLYLYQKSSSKDSEELSGGRPITSFSRGTYNMEVVKMVQEDTLDGPTEFECHVTIPKTEIKIVAVTKYQPRVSVSTGAVTKDSSTQQAPAALLVVLSLVICVLHH